VADVAVSIRNYLLAQSAITDIVGQRIYADALPQNATLPAIEMSVISDVPEMQLSDITGITKARIQLNTVATRRSVARSVSAAIRTCGVAAIKGTYTSVSIRGVAIAETFDTPIYATDGTDDHRYASAVDLLVDYSET